MLNLRSANLALATSVLLLATGSAHAADQWQSHAPTRPLPTTVVRPLTEGPKFYIDGKSGDDAASGTQEKPWKTIAFGISKLTAGDTLVIGGGVYHEHITATLVGTEDKPITIRSSGELAIVDGGLPEFLYDHATAWELCPAAEGGVDGEYRSTKVYSGLEQTQGDLRVSLLGNFADSMTPLHGYWNRGDLQSDNPYFSLNETDDDAPAAGATTAKAPNSKPTAAAPLAMPDAGFKKGSAVATAGPSNTAKPSKLEVGKTGKSKHVYCGPGIWYDATTGRIHCRLAHTKLPGLGDDNYRGETDPRKTPLIIAPWSAGSVFKLAHSKHVKLEDLVLRGARQPLLYLDGGQMLTVSGCHLYGGQSPIKADGVYGFTMTDTACRGLAAPWTFRGGLKYRSIESRLFTTGGWDPTGADGAMYTISRCEFTDSVDGMFIGNTSHVTLYENLFDNISDDGIFVTASTGYDGHTPGGGHEIYHNRFARILTAFAFGVGHARQKIVKDPIPPAKWGEKQLGAGISIHHNVFDFRRPVHYYWPTGPDAPQELSSLGKFGGDHGTPGWEKMDIYNNTFLAGDPPRYDYGTGGIIHGMVLGTKRRVVNNIFYQIHGLPGQSLPPADMDLEARNNLFWSATDGGTFSPDQWCARFRNSPDGKKRPEWTKDDRFADPKFAGISSDWREPVDLRLQAGSPALGVALRADATTKRIVEPPGFETENAGPVDLGAVPRGVAPSRVGVHGRIDFFGNAETRGSGQIELVRSTGLHSKTTSTGTARAPLRAVVVTGYPAFDAPLVAYALRRRGVIVDEVDKQWLDPRSYAQYDLVVVDGSFTRAGLKTTKFTDDELPIVRQFLESGGKLWLCRDRTDLFASDAGRSLLEELIGPQPRDNATRFSLRLPEHAWVKHLTVAKGTEPGVDLSWIASSSNSAPSWSRGEAVIGTESGRTLLGDVKVGRGRIVYFGWSPAASLPHGRVPPKVADEAKFEAQMRIVTNVAEDLTAPKP